MLVYQRVDFIVSNDHPSNAGPTDRKNWSMPVPGKLDPSLPAKCSDKGLEAATDMD